MIEIVLFLVGALVLWAWSYACYRDGYNRGTIDEIKRGRDWPQ